MVERYIVFIQARACLKKKKKILGIFISVVTFSSNKVCDHGIVCEREITAFQMTVISEGVCVCIRMCVIMVIWINVCACLLTHTYAEFCGFVFDLPPHPLRDGVVFTGYKKLNCFQH